MLLSHSDFLSRKAMECCIRWISWNLRKRSHRVSRIETAESQGSKGLQAPIVNQVGKGHPKKSPLAGGLCGICALTEVKRDRHA